VEIGNVRSTGQRYEAGGRWRGQMPPFDGRHLWIVLAVYRVTDPARVRQLMGPGNLLTVEGVGCFWCGKEWTATVGAHCAGGSGVTEGSQSAD